MHRPRAIAFEQCGSPVRSHVGHRGPALRDHGRGGRATPAFTLVELIVVVTVIILILAIAVPGLSKMNSEMRMTSAQQMMQGVTTRAYLLSLADRAMTAVRFFPGDWDTVDTSEKQTPGGRQHMAVYSYVGTTVNPDTLLPELHEYFERAKDLPSVKMPEGVWAAPVEALAQYSVMLGPKKYNVFGPDFVLNGTPNQFRFNVDRSVGDGIDFLNADDFLIVCDPETGMRVGTPAPYRLRAYVPVVGGAGYEANADINTGAWYQRYGFSGVVTYAREPFAQLGLAAVGVDRQKLLRETGRPYLVHRFSGGLLAGAQPPQ